MKRHATRTVIHRVSALLAAAFSCAAASAAAQPAAAPAPVGTWDWFNDVQVTLAFDGTLRNSNHDSGTWRALDAGQRRYELSWDKGWLDTLALSADGAMLEGANKDGHRVWGKRRDAALSWQLAGVYEAIHARWRDLVILMADGTFRRGSGDGGRWTFDGAALDLAWSNAPAERLSLRRAGRFRSRAPRFLLVKRAEPSVAAFVAGTTAPPPTTQMIVETSPALAPAPMPPPVVTLVEAPPLNAPRWRIIGTWERARASTFERFHLDDSGRFRHTTRTSMTNGRWSYAAGVVRLVWPGSGRRMLFELRAPGRLRTRDRGVVLLKVGAPGAHPRR